MNPKKTAEDERISGGKACQTALEALRSEPAKRVFELSMRKYLKDKSET